MPSGGYSTSVLASSFALLLRLRNKPSHLTDPVGPTPFWNGGNWLIGLPSSPYAIPDGGFKFPYIAIAPFASSFLLVAGSEGQQRGH